VNNCFDCRFVQNCREFDSAINRYERRGSTLDDAMKEAAKETANFCNKYVEWHGTCTITK
jgi:hypothetical protein